MKRLSTAALLALVAAPAAADLLVTEVVGTVRTTAHAGEMQKLLATLDQVADGSEIILAMNARAVMVDLESGNEFELRGKERYLITSAGPKSSQGNIVASKPLPEKNLPAVRISGRKASQASMMMQKQDLPSRELEFVEPVNLDSFRNIPGAAPVPGMLSLQAPLPREVVLERPVLRWSKHHGSTGYQVRVAGVDVASSWEKQTTSLELGLPDSLELKPGTTYRWGVEALRDHQVLKRVEGSFSIMSAETKRTLDRLKPDAGAPFSRRVLYAAQLEQAGATSVARALWETLARERPDDPVLRTRARENANDRMDHE